MISRHDKDDYSEVITPNLDITMYCNKHIVPNSTVGQCPKGLGVHYFKLLYLFTCIIFVCTLKNAFYLQTIKLSFERLSLVTDNILQHGMAIMNQINISILSPHIIVKSKSIGTSYTDSVDFICSSAFKRHNTVYANYKTHFYPLTFYLHTHFSLHAPLSTIL